MQCQKKKRDGKQCRAPALSDNKHCALHAEPGRAKELGSKGGRRRTMVICWQSRSLKSVLGSSIRKSLTRSATWGRACCVLSKWQTSSDGWACSKGMT
jgi:hypothetical protein